MVRLNKYQLFTIIGISYFLYDCFLNKWASSASSNIIDNVKRNLSLCAKDAAKLHYDNPTIFYATFQNCLKKHVPLFDMEIDKFKNEFHDERTLFPLSKNYAQEKCKWLTIGIGGSSKAEAAFHQKYPECKIYGVEPVSFGDFSKIGTIIPFGVGLEETEIELKVMVDKESNKYEMKKTKVISLTNLLDNFIESRFIHYLTIDVEGYEYFILRELLKNGKFENEDITFCQIEAELHDPLFQSVNLARFILDFIDVSSPYIHVSSRGKTNFFANYKNPECQKAFNFNSYFIDQ